MDGGYIYFCMLSVFISQIQSEVGGCLDFLSHIYKIFGFEYSLALSTRPEKYLGEIETWDQAEQVSGSLRRYFRI